MNTPETNPHSPEAILALARATRAESQEPVVDDANPWPVMKETADLGWHNRKVEEARREQPNFPCVNP